MVSPFLGTLYYSQFYHERFTSLVYKSSWPLLPKPLEATQWFAKKNSGALGFCCLAASLSGVVNQTGLALPADKIHLRGSENKGWLF